MKSAGEALARSRQAVSALLSPDLSDEEKETLARQQSLRLLRLFASITGRILLAVLVPIAALLLLDRLGLVVQEDVATALRSWTVILLSLALTPLLLLRRP